MRQISASEQLNLNQHDSLLTLCDFSGILSAECIWCNLPLSTEYGTCKTVKARFWPWLWGRCLQNLEVVPTSLGSGRYFVMCTKYMLSTGLFDSTSLLSLSPLCFSLLSLLANGSNSQTGKRRAKRTSRTTRSYRSRPRGGSAQGVGSKPYASQSPGADGLQSMGPGRVPTKGYR